MTSDSSPAAEGGTGTGGGSGSGGGGGGGSTNSFSQRGSLPWAQVVRGGGEAEPVAPRSPSASSPSVVREPRPEFSDQVTVTVPLTAAMAESQPESSEGSSSNGNESGVRRSAWNRPSANGVVDGGVTPVMGAASWPALSELTRPLPKSSSSPAESSYRSTSDGSVTVSQAPVISQAPQKHVKNNTSQHSNHNHNRQRPMKRGGGAGGGYNRMPPGPPPPPPPMPPYPLFNTPYGGFMPAVLDSPYNGNSFVPTRPVAGIGSHSHPVHDQPFNRKRNNFGPRPRGDGGPYLNNGPGGRRDHHDREWRGPRSHGAVIPHHGAPPPPQPPMSYLQQPHLGPAPFIAPQYVAPMGYGMPPPPPPPPPPIRQLVYVPPILPYPLTLSESIRHQIEYYFSDDNLARDKYLRSKMDGEGWVPITLIAGFQRVKTLTTDLQMVLSSIRDSTIVEVQGENIRRRNEWRKWVNTSVNVPLDSSSQSPKATTDGSTIETTLQNLSLDASAANEERTTITGPSDSIETDNEVTTGDELMNPNPNSNPSTSYEDN